MAVLSVEKVGQLSLGVSAVDGALPRFKLGDFAVLYGPAAHRVSLALCVRCGLPPDEGGLGSSAVFVDGGNSFDPYLVAELARSYGLDSRAALEGIYVSRAFTAYQFSALVLEELENFLSGRRAKLLVVSDVASLFLDRDIPRATAKDLFMRVCAKLWEIAKREQAMVVATCLPRRRSRQGLFFEAVLFGRANVLARFKVEGKILSFVLEDHPRVEPFSVDLPTDRALLTDFEV
ncbi:MAG: hypothetical protein ACUVUE_03805 [Candidatus Bathycorpusculaceae bacterium]